MHISRPPILKKGVKAILPTTIFERIQAIRSRRHQLRLLETIGIINATMRFVERHGTVVRYGPFSGMIYPLDSALNRHSIPKILGTYECELHPFISSIASRKYDHIIDIGSAEGYYAIGFARMFNTEVIAYDPEPRERAFCQKMAHLNGVGHLLQTRKLFQATDIESYRTQKVLLICDCEGYEKYIFTEKTTKNTTNWDLLIELHGDTAKSLPLLPWPHATTVTTAAVRDSEFPELVHVGRADKLLSEYRNERQSWLLCDSQTISLADSLSIPSYEAEHS